MTTRRTRCRVGRAHDATREGGALVGDGGARHQRHLGLCRLAQLFARQAQPRQRQLVVGFGGFGGGVVVGVGGGCGGVWEAKAAAS